MNGGERPTTPKSGDLSSMVRRTSAAPLSEAMPSLTGMGYPVMGKAGKDIRKAHKPHQAAQNFAIWLQAYELAGVYTPEELGVLYREFARMDQREPTAENMLFGALAGLPKKSGIERKGSYGGERRRRWVVTPIKFKRPDKATDPSEPAPPVAAVPEPAPGGAQIIRPFGNASPSRPEVVKGPSILNRYAFLDLEAQRHEARQMKAMIRQEMHRSRKQRGSRVARVGRLAA